MTVTDTYSNYLQVKPEEVDFPSTFYPLPDKPYIVVCTGSFSSSRVYDYYNKVIELLQFKILDLKSYTVVQIGEPDDYAITSTRYLDLRNQLSLRQKTFLIENCDLLLCNESIYAHIAAAKEKKSVVLYGPNPSETSKSYFAKNESSIESGSPYSYLDEESPKGVNSIKPEDVSYCVAQSLEFEIVSSSSSRLGLVKSIETIKINDLFLKNSIDFIPDYPIQPDSPGKFLCRFDLSPNTQALFHFYSFFSAPVYASDPLNVDFLRNFKDKIPHVFYSLDGNYSKDFVKLLHSMGFKYTLLTNKTGEELSKIKWDLFDYNGVISKDIKSRLEEVKSLNLKGNESFDTTRFYLSRGKLYPSRWHWQEGIDMKEWIDNGKKLGPLDSKNFLESWNNFYIFKNLENDMEENQIDNNCNKI